MRFLRHSVDQYGVYNSVMRAVLELDNAKFRN